jgi:hypothetical protein
VASILMGVWRSEDFSQTNEKTALVRSLAAHKKREKSKNVSTETFLFDRCALNGRRLIRILVGSFAGDLRHENVVNNQHKSTELIQLRTCRCLTRTKKINIF